MRQAKPDIQVEAYFAAHELRRILQDQSLTPSAQISLCQRRIEQVIKAFLPPSGTRKSAE